MWSVKRQLVFLEKASILELALKTLVNVSTQKCSSYFFNLKKGIISNFESLKFNLIKQSIPLSYLSINDPVMKKTYACKANDRIQTYNILEKKNNNRPNE